jgi:hypothetical protein
MKKSSKLLEGRTSDMEVRPFSLDVEKFRIEIQKGMER